MITFLVLHPRLFIPFRHNRLESLLAKSHDERRNVAAACNAVVLLTEERVCATVSKAHSPITSALEAPYALSSAAVSPLFRCSAPKYHQTQKSICGSNKVPQGQSTPHTYVFHDKNRINQQEREGSFHCNKN